MDTVGAGYNVTTCGDTLDKYPLNANQGSDKGSRSTPKAQVLTVFGFALPVATYFWSIYHFGVNVIWGDQWTDINVIAHSYSGTLGWKLLWAQHNEERMLFPKLLVVLLAHTTHLNLFVEMYLGAILLVLTAAAIVVAHRRRSPSTPWLYYCPVAFLLFSLVQYGNTLWGFQIAWYIDLCALGIALLLLDRPMLSWLALTGAMAAAVVGSFSSFQGLFIWPAGLVIFYHRRRPWRFTSTWVVAGIATWAFYYVGYNSNQINQVPSFGSWGNIARFFFIEIGDVVGQSIPDTPHAGNNAVLFLGIVIFVGAMYAVFRYGLRRDDRGGGPIGVALICFGLLCALSTAIGRYPLGLWEASASRYTTNDLLILGGTYLALLDRPRIRGSLTGWRKGTLVAFRSSVIALICLQVGLGNYNALPGERSISTAQAATEDVVVNIRRAPSPAVFDIDALDSQPFVREMAEDARRLNLSIFATHAAVVYMRDGLILGRWADGQISPVRPSRGIRDGQLVTLQLVAFGGSVPLFLRECNPHILAGDVHACGATAVVTTPLAHGQRRARFRVVTGTVGDGTCDPGETCYISVTSNPDGTFSKGLREFDTQALAAIAIA